MATLRWSFDVPASIDEVWRVLSDTDAFNRHAGLGFKFRREDGRVRGEVRIAGLLTTWVEEPFEIQAPTRFVSRRVYDGGPVESATATCRLAEHAAGTHVDYEVVLAPRGAWTGLLVDTVARVAVKPGLDRTLASVGDLLAGRLQTGWDRPPDLQPKARQRLAQRLERVDPRIASALVDLAHNAPLATQCRLRPLQVAAQTGLAAEDVIVGFLDAVAAGALELAWRVVCPRCRRGQERGDLLALAEAGVHCETCNVAYDGSLADQVEATFRFPKDIRPEEEPEDCALSPGRTPHVLAQLQVAAGGEVEIETRLRRGCYRVESDEGIALVEVLEEGPASAVIDVGAQRLRPRELAVGAGHVVLRVRNRHERPVRVALHERWRPPYALSAVTLLASERVRAKVPGFRIHPDLRTRVEHGYAITAKGIPRAIELLAEALAQPTEGGPLRAHRLRADTLVAFSPTAEGALGVAEEAVKMLRPTSVGVAHGPVVFLDDASDRRRATLGGPAIDAAFDMALFVGRPRVALHPDAVARPDFAAALESRPNVGRVQRRGAPDLVVFSSMVVAPTGPGQAPPAADASAPSRPISAPPASIERVGPYQILRELGRGGMGRVLEGVGADGRRVAVKVLLARYRTHAVLQQRFFNEAWYASRLHHPNLVEVRDFGLEDEQPWIAMECLVGRTLQARLRSGPMTEPEALPVLFAVCDALQALHERGLVHRDLKPSNVFLVDAPTDVPGATKLLDFGLVRRSGVHRSEGIAGTPDYISPEQLFGEPLRPEADVFAIGVLAYRMLAGQLPFEGSADERLVGRVTLDPSALRALDDLGRLAPAIQAALSPDPQQRPASAGVLKALLRDATGP